MQLRCLINKYNLPPNFEIDLLKRGVYSRAAFILSVLLAAAFKRERRLLQGCV